MTLLTKVTRSGGRATFSSNEGVPLFQINEYHEAVILVLEDGSLSVKSVTEVNRNNVTFSIYNPSRHRIKIDGFETDDLETPFFWISPEPDFMIVKVTLNSPIL
jgi:hypothetical protein